MPTLAPTGLALGALADAWLGDPRRGHPVAAYGRWAGWLERRFWADDVPRGQAYAAVAVVLPTAAALAADRMTRRRPLAHVALTGLVTWSVLGGTTLRREGSRMADALAAGNLVAGRAQLSSLCGRDPSRLGADELARATVESVAENTSDAVVAPLFWGALLGVPGLVGYRCVNTLDAMVGHRSPRYQRFGTASARADDAANLAPSRLTGALAAVAAPLVGGSRAATWRVMRRDGGAHPSPNSGQCEAAFAGALRVRLGGANIYESRVEERPALGDGPAPSPADIAPAVTLSRAVEALALLLALAVAVLRGRR